MIMNHTPKALQISAAERLRESIEVLGTQKGLGLAVVINKAFAEVNNGKHNPYIEIMAKRFAKIKGVDLEL